MSSASISPRAFGRDGNLFTLCPRRLGHALGVVQKPGKLFRGYLSGGQHLFEAFFQMLLPVCAHCHVRGARKVKVAPVFKLLQQVLVALLAYC